MQKAKLAAQERITKKRIDDQEKMHNTNQIGYTPSYGTTSLLAQFVSLFGWFLVAISLLVLLVSIAKGSRDSFNLISIMPSLTVFVGGLLLVMAGQMTRANVDTADNTGHILSILKKEH